MHILLNDFFTKQNSAGIVEMAIISSQSTVIEVQNQEEASMGNNQFSGLSG